MNKKTIITIALLVIFAGCGAYEKTPVNGTFEVIGKQYQPSKVIPVYGGKYVQFASVPEDYLTSVQTKNQIYAITDKQSYYTILQGKTYKFRGYVYDDFKLQIEYAEPINK